MRFLPLIWSGIWRKPGRTIRFVAVDVREAERLRKAQEAGIEAELSTMRGID